MTFAELLALGFLLHFIGMFITHQWNNELFYSQMIKRLYRVKSTSSGIIDSRIDKLTDIEKKALEL